MKKYPPLPTLEEALAAFRQIKWPKKATKFDWESMLIHWYGCKNQSETAEKFGIHQASLSKMFRRLGIHMGKGALTAIHVLPMDKIAEAYNNGASTVELGREYGVDPEVIRKRMMRRGIDRRPRGSYERRGQENPQWKGGKKQDREQNRLARAIAEWCLGEKLPEDAVVHHRNEDESDNRPDNLVVFPSNPHHLRFHQQLLKIQLASEQVETIQVELENGGRPLPPPPYPIELLLEKGRLDPYGTRIALAKFQAGSEPFPT